MEPCCFIDDYDIEPPRVHNALTRVARKPHRCVECGGAIAAGDEYEYVSGLWEKWATYKTCLTCVRIRRDLFCGGWVCGELSEQLSECFGVGLTDIPADG